MARVGGGAGEAEAMGVGATGAIGTTEAMEGEGVDEVLAGAGVGDEAALVDESGTAGRDNIEATAAEELLDEDEAELGGGEAPVTTTGGTDEADEAEMIFARGGAA